MKTAVLIILLMTFLLTGCSQSVVPANADTEYEIPTVTITPSPTSAPVPEYIEPVFIDPAGTDIISRFIPPEGFVRVETAEGSFERYLQTLPLKADGTKVTLYDGEVKYRQVYAAILDMDIGSKDLQQCADTLIRLRAEYLYSMGRYDDINFRFVSGFEAKFSKWREGYGITVSGGTKASWYAKSSNDSSPESFSRYLEVVYTYAGTLSLIDELKDKAIEDLAIGDVFIIGGSPGHCAMVADAAVNPDTGEKVFLLVQGNMPAQEVQVVMGQKRLSPWYSADIVNILRTPEWQFSRDSLKTWPEA